MQACGSGSGPPRQPSEPPPPPIRVPNAAPSVVRDVYPRLEGGERGFRAWLNAQAWRVELARAEGAAMARDDLTAVVARHVLAAYLDAAPPGLVGRFADWLAQHVAAAAGGSARVRWQWEVTALAWVCEACGLPDDDGAIGGRGPVGRGGLCGHGLAASPFHSVAARGCGLSARAALPGLQHQ